MSGRVRSWRTGAQEGAVNIGTSVRAVAAAGGRQRPHPALRAAIFGACMATAALAASASALEAQQVVPVHQEPRHRLVFDGGQVKLLDVQILPGDTTKFHTHDSAILYVTLSNSTTVSQNLGGNLRDVAPAADPFMGATAASTANAGRVMSTTSYAERPVTHRVANVGSAMFRLFAIANYGPGTDATTPESNPPGEQLLENRWFRAWRVEIAPGQATEWRRLATPDVVVQALPGEVEVEGRGGESSVLRVTKQAGEWYYGEAGTEYRLRNRGSQPVVVTVVSVR